MPLMSGLRTFSWKLNVLAATTVPCISVQLHVAVADRLPVTVLVLVRLGLAAVDPLHPCAGAAEVATVVAVVDRGVARGRRHRGVLGRPDEVLPRQVAARLLQ